VIIDITQGLSPGMAGFPGDAAYEEGWTFRLGPDCPVNVSRVSFSVHCGTHADAPLHYNSKGAAAGALALEPYIGPCRVIDARGKGPVCEPSEIAAALDGAPPRILLRLMDRLDPKQWPAGFRALDPALIDALAARGCRLIATDAPSVDPEHCKLLRSHQACHRAGMAILEGVVLDGIPEGRYELVALPLPIAGVEATPIRAILRELGG